MTPIARSGPISFWVGFSSQTRIFADPEPDVGTFPGIFGSAELGCSSVTNAHAQIRTDVRIGATLQTSLEVSNLFSTNKETNDGHEAPPRRPPRRPPPRRLQLDQARREEVGDQGRSQERAEEDHCQEATAKKPRRRSAPPLSCVPKPPPRRLTPLSSTPRPRRRRFTQTVQEARATARETAKTVVDVPVGAALNLSEKVSELVEPWTDQASAEKKVKSYRAELTKTFKRAERRGTTTRRKATTKAKKQRNQLERQVRKQQKNVEKQVKATNKDVSKHIEAQVDVVTKRASQVQTDVSKVAETQGKKAQELVNKVTEQITALRLTLSPAPAESRLTGEDRLTSYLVSRCITSPPSPTVPSLGPLVLTGRPGRPARAVPILGRHDRSAPDRD